MAIDRYAKVVLTVIALCLLYLCLGRPAIMTGAAAQTSVASDSRLILRGWTDATGKEWRFPQPASYTNGAAPLPGGEAKR